MSFLGINIVITFADFAQRLINIIGRFILKILASLGYTTGTVLEKTADTLADVAKTGIDIADGTLHSVGDILKNENQRIGNSVDSHIEKSTSAITQPEPDNSNSTIQTPTQTASWCLVGEFKERRGCVAVSNTDKCMSGQLFPSQQQCLNPIIPHN
jgi:hypothetical protein